MAVHKYPNVTKVFVRGISTGGAIHPFIYSIKASNITIHKQRLCSAFIFRMLSSIREGLTAPSGRDGLFFIIYYGKSFSNHALLDTSNFKARVYFPILLTRVPGLARGFFVLLELATR